MDKDTLKAIEIINDILGYLIVGVENRYYIRLQRQDLYKIIKDNKGK